MTGPPAAGEGGWGEGGEQSDSRACDSLKTKQHEQKLRVQHAYQATNEALPLPIAHQPSNNALILPTAYQASNNALILPTGSQHT